MGIITLLGGLIAAATLVSTKKPELKPFIDRISQYQGYIGIVLTIYGIWYAFYFIGNAGIWLDVAPLRFGLYLVVTILNLAMGMILGYDLIKKFITKAPASTAPVTETVGVTTASSIPTQPTTTVFEQHAEALRSKLISYQEKIGVAAIVGGILTLFI